MRLFLCLLVLSLVACDRPKCDEYVCDYIPSEGENRQCTKSEHDMVSKYTIYTLSDTCLTDQSCVISLSDSPSFCQAKTYVQPGTILPGQPCTVNASCSTGTCDTNKCTGIAEGKSCSSDRVCGVGLFCKTTGEEANCAKVGIQDTDCDLNNKCDYNLVCNLGKCAQVGSIATGQPGMAAMACASYYSQGFTDAEGITTYQCVAGPKLQGEHNTSVPARCLVGNKGCHYNIGDKELITDCQCGITRLGESFCPFGKGDLADRITLYFDYLRANKQVCHISYSPKGLCAPTDVSDKNKEYWKAVESYYILMHGYKFADNPVCVKTMINADFFYAQKMAGDEPTPPDPPHPHEDGAVMTVTSLCTLLLAALYLQIIIISHSPV